MKVLTENPVTIDGEKVDPNSMYLNLDAKPNYETGDAGPIGEGLGEYATAGGGSWGGTHLSMDGDFSQGSEPWAGTHSGTEEYSEARGDRRRRRSSMSKDQKRTTRRAGWDKFKDSGVGQAILDFGIQKLNQSNNRGDFNDDMGNQGGFNNLPPVSNDPPIVFDNEEEGWWAKKSTGAKVGIIVGALALLGGGGYLIYRQMKK